MAKQMSNLNKYDNVFMEIFGVHAEELAALTFRSMAQRDSVGHMRLMADIESKFDVMLDTEDIVGFSSYKKGKEILIKYGVEI